MWVENVLCGHERPSFRVVIVAEALRCCVTQTGLPWVDTSFR